MTDKWFKDEIPGSSLNATNSADAKDQAPAQPVVWISPKRAAEMFDISQATLWRWVKYQPGFPRPVKLSPGCTRFNLQQLSEFARAKQGEK